MNYQYPDSDVLSSLGYGVIGIYIYIAIISDVNEKAFCFNISSEHSSTVRGVDVKSY